MKKIFHYLLLLAVVKIFFITSIYFFVNYNWIEVPINISKIQTQQNTGLYSFVLIGLIGPFLEESMFRLALIFKPIYVATSCCFVFLYLYSYYTGIELASFDSFLSRAIIAILLFFLVYKLCSKYSHFMSYIWINHTSIIVIVMSFLFGLFHFMNYDIESLSFVNSFVILIPHFISGLIYSHLRLNYDFRSVVITHILFNMMGILITKI